MVEYRCFHCGYIAAQRINLKNHLNQNVCKIVDDDVDRND